jgi:hypothetical protein
MGAQFHAAKDLARRGTPYAYPDPRQVMLELVLARHEVEAAIAIMKRSWWPVITVVVAVGLSA